MSLKSHCGLPMAPRFVLMVSIRRIQMIHTEYSVEDSCVYYVVKQAIPGEWQWSMTRGTLGKEKIL